MQVASRISAKQVSRAVVCRAQSKQSPAAQKAAAVVAGLPALIAASPAFALVDDRLNGDGVGLPFGINDGILGWVLVGVLSLVWALWYNAQKDLGDFEDPDAGLKIDDRD
ncbi:uncharacterized protein HaLaN_14558, partial [Haematococcus lacustris]